MYLIGGDGTQKGIEKLLVRARQRHLIISFVGIPKTIDNDIPLIDYSFGFHTACEKAQKMIESAVVEANSAINGVGLVKLMGRYSGFIARNASLSNCQVDICIIPELPWELNGPRGLLEQVV